MAPRTRNRDYYEFDELGCLSGRVAYRVSRFKGIPPTAAKKSWSRPLGIQLMRNEDSFGLRTNILRITERERERERGNVFLGFLCISRC